MQTTTEVTLNDDEGGELSLPVKPRSLSITVLSIAASQMAAATSEPSQSCQRVAAPEIRLEVAAARGPSTPPASAPVSIPQTHNLHYPNIHVTRSPCQIYPREMATSREEDAGKSAFAALCIRAVHQLWLILII